MWIDKHGEPVLFRHTGMAARNIQDLLSDGKTPCERRFGMPFTGSVIPFGAMVEYHPVAAKDISRLKVT